CLFNPPGDSEHMGGRVPHVQLANIPRHVRRRPSDLKTLLKAALVDSINVLHPNRHPHALVGGIVAFGAKRHLEGALASTALGVLAQEDLAVARANAPNRGGTAPVPPLLPSELLEPSEALLDVRDVQNRCQSFRVHAPCPPGVGERTNSELLDTRAPAVNIVTERVGRDADLV